MDNTKTINILSLCTGCGGLELGLSLTLEAVFRIVAVEVEAYALANLAAKAQEGRLAIEAMWPDVKTFPAKRFRGCFDFVLAGYPCQPFSIAGKRQGEKDERHLWPHIRRIVQAVEPLWCFFENVPGHLTIGFPEVYRSLRDMGYSVEAGLFTAEECGAPHKRERLFILAHSEHNGYSKRAGAQSFSTSVCNAEKGQNNTSNAKRTNESSELADTGTTEFQGRQSQQGNDGAKFKAIAGSCYKWPARPGQPQYEWEEPRVIPNSCDGGRRKLLQQEQKRRCNIETNVRGKSKISMEGQAQSGVGGAVDGTKYRVDRLRLLGNGVVPQCAELAFRNLIRKFEREFE